jgi:peptidyl-tRNA hydrolase, PTH2 family
VNEDKVQQVIVMINMKIRKGKLIAQGAHAGMMFMTRKLKQLPRLTGSRLVGAFTEEELEWLKGSFTKIVLQVPSEEALVAVYEKAKAAGLTVYMVEDKGLTEFKDEQGNPRKTLTCLAIGPHAKSKIDPITKDLELY